MFLLLFVVNGCHDSDFLGTDEKTVSKNANDSDRKTRLAADARLRELQQTMVMRHVSSFYYPDGEFGFHRIRFADYNARNRLGEKAAIDAYGNVVSLEQMLNRMTRRYRSRWGALNFEIAESVSRQKAGNDEATRHQYMAWYDIATTTKEAVVNTIRHAGGEVGVISDTPPIVQFESSLSQVHKLGLNGLIRRIDNIDKVDVVTSGVAAETSAHFTGADVSFNSNGNFGDNVKVGVMELIRNGCRIRDEHEAFEFANVVYAQTNFQCSSDSDCESACSEGGNWPPECVSTANGDFCVENHPTAVASRISMSVDGNPNHAARAEIYVANAWDINHNTSWLEEALNMYHWFHDNGVTVINQSIGLSVARYNARDHIRDWVSRSWDHTIVKASGNVNNSADEVAGCHALNAICVGGVHAQNSYNTFADDVMFSLSKWKNPLFSSAHSQTPNEPKEAERPDVVSEGENAHVARYRTKLYWRKTDGTSFATPTVAGLIAMYAACGDGEISNPRLMRAILKTSSWVPQYLEADPFADFYPISGFSPDSFAGAGIPTGQRLLDWCQVPDDGSTTEKGNRGIGSNSGEFEGSSKESVPEWMWGFGPDTSMLVSQTLANDPIWSELRYQAGGRIQEIGDLGEVDGGRLRATLSFETCPGASPLPYTPTIQPAADFDLIACSVNEEECVAVSESFDDTNEGFDVVVDGSYSDLKLFLIGPHSSDCNGDNTERWSAAWTIWR